MKSTYYVFARQTGTFYDAIEAEDREEAMKIFLERNPDLKSEALENFNFDAENELEVNLDDGVVPWLSAVSLMDDELRERLHNEMAPCDPQEFLNAYVQEHEKKFGEEFTVD